MNNERRAVLAKAGRFIGGGMIGVGVAEGAIKSALAGQVATPALAQHSLGYGADGESAESTLNRPDPEWRARQEAEQKIYAAHSKLRQREELRLALRNPDALDPDLAALKSVSPYWRMQVMQARHAARMTVREKWEEKIRSLRESPGHMIDSLLGKLLAEMEGA